MADLFLRKLNGSTWLLTKLTFPFVVFDWFRVFPEISCVPRAVGVVHFSNPIGSNIPQRNEFNPKVLHPKVLQATESITL